MDILSNLTPQEIMQSKKSLRRQLLAQENLISKKIALLSGSTIGEIKNIYELYLLQHGIRPQFWTGEFNRFYEDVIFENSALKEFAPDLIYIHTSNKNILEYPSPLDTAETSLQKLDACYAHMEQVWVKAKSVFHCPVIQNNFDPLPIRLFGNSDCYRSSGRLHFIHALNEKLNDYARSNEDFHINDIDYLSANLGLQRWADPKFWYLYKYALNPDAIPALCKNLAVITKSIFGKNKKALALDLDNTLWGGVIGDDGLEGIEIGGESPAGMAFADFQQYLKNCADLGILLSVCSKNDQEFACSGFTHAGSVLKTDDFIEFVANWQDKSSNLQLIAQKLNILPESIVFVDDNPAERELVQSALPEVSIPAIGDPSNSALALDAAGYFEVTAFSAEDAKRNTFYKQDQKRAEEQKAFQNYEEYLQSLQMHCVFGKFENAQRITQLINKTNQFNLTTTRMTQSEVEQIAKSPHYLSISAQLADKFGDNGIVSVLIGKVSDQSLVIELWIMSCRVFQRNLEYAMFDELVRQCRQKGVQSITGQYLPTAKNGYVKNLYRDLGFSGTNENTWEFNIPQDYVNKNTVIGVESYDK